MSEYAPILISVYSRFESLKQSVESLKANELAKESDLYIVSDAAGRESDIEIVKKIREYILGIDGFKSVNPIFREQNLGANVSPTLAYFEVLNKHQKIIFLEDDIVVSKSFLRFLNDGLERFKDNQQVYSISGYCPPPAYMPEFKSRAMRAPFHCPWGFATWKDRADVIDMEYNPYKEVMQNRELVKYIAKYAPFMLEALRNDYYNPSLFFVDVRTTFQMLLKGMFTIYPALSLTKNIGLDGNGARGAVNFELMEQGVYDELTIEDWDVLRNKEFEELFISHGHSINPKQIISSFLFKYNLRDEAQLIIDIAKKWRKK